MELRDYLKVVRRRWRVIVACLIVVVALASVVTLRTTPQYESKARLFVSTSEQSTSDAYQGGLLATQRVSSYADLPKGERLSSRVIDDLGLKMTASDLAAKINTTVVPDTVILEISVTDPARSKRAGSVRRSPGSCRPSSVTWRLPPGRSNAPIKASIIDSASLPTPRSRRSRCATLAWPSCSGCCSASVWP